MLGKKNLLNIFYIFELSFRSVSNDVNSTYTIATEERQNFRERRMEEDRRQRELDREASKEEKQKDRDRAREDNLQSNLLIAGVLARILPGASDQVEKTKPKNLEVQYKPANGSEPFPLAVSLSTLSSLLRFLSSKHFKLNPSPFF